MDFFDYRSYSMVRNIWSTLCAALSIFPALHRLGKSLSRRKIAILADSNDAEFLKNILTDSGLFKKENLEIVTDRDVRRMENISLSILHWKSFKDNLEQVLDAKENKYALIVYAPTDEGHIDEESMQKIGECSNAIVVNMRGRLLNDVFTCMMTTKEDK